MPVLLFSCGGLKKLPVENKQVVIVPMEKEELLITETFSYEEELTAAIDEPENKPVVPEVKKYSGNAVEHQIGEPASKDTIRVIDTQTDEALDSERVARNAYIWSFIPLTGLLFFVGFLLGLIVTLVLLAKLKKYSYVTATTLDYQERARRTLLITSLVVGLLYLLAFILLLLILAVFW